MDPTAWVGRDIDGRYVVESVLGVGGMGTVLRAKHRFTGVAVAIKVLKPELQADTGVQDRFLAEAQAPNAIGHAAIVKVLDAGRTSEGTLYMAMELLRGQSLRAALSRGELTAEQGKRVLLDLCTVLGHAHARNFIHRDLKPDNVFLCAPNDEVKLLDFGIAKMLDDVRQLRTAAGAVLGTPAYMAPEQLADARNVDSRADLWALGVMFYEMVTGRLPLAGATPHDMLSAVAFGEVTPIRTYLPNVTRDLEVFFDRALARDPRRRFGAAIELAHALAPLAIPSVSRVMVPVGVMSTAASGATLATAAPIATPPRVETVAATSEPAVIPPQVYAPVAPQVVYAAPVHAAIAPQAPPQGVARVAPAPSRRPSKLLPIIGVIVLVAIAVGITLAVTGDSRGTHIAVASDAAKVDPAPDATSSDPTKPDPTKPDPSKLDPSKPDPAKLDPSKTNPAKPDPARPDPSKVNPTKPVPANPDPRKRDPAKPDPAKPDPAKPDPAKPDPAKPDPAKPDPTKPDPAKPARLDPDPPARLTRQECQQRCNKVATTCGTQLQTCVDDCLRFAGARECFDRSDRNCGDGAMCAANLMCNGRVPNGGDSCRSVVNCQLGCTFGDLSCSCNCMARLDPRQIYFLARLNSCALRCNLDPTCMATSCANQEAQCR